jgi:hypothetical protein
LKCDACVPDRLEYVLSLQERLAAVLEIGVGGKLLKLHHHHMSITGFLIVESPEDLLHHLFRKILHRQNR